MTSANGAQGVPPTAEQIREAMEAAFDNQIKQVVGVMVHGMLVSVQGVPPERTIASFCKAAGAMAAQVFIGNDLEKTFKLRQAMKKAFEEGMATVPVNASPPTMGAPLLMTAVPPHLLRRQ